MEKILKRLNGKKTVIGTAFLLVARFFTETGIGEGTELVDIIVTASNWIGEFFGVLGLGHKGVKAMKPKDTPTQ